MVKSFYLNNIVYHIAGTAAVFFVISYFQPALFRIGGLFLLLLGVAIFIDAIIIYSKKGISAKRIVAERLSIGDPNKVLIELHNSYLFPAKASIIDELPAQFQDRKWLRKVRIGSHTTYNLEYFLRPESRGEYVFYDINVFVHAPLAVW